jgi:RNA polymerase II subunit A-like phosphatase
MKIVTPYWLFECFARWTRADETPYIIEVEDDRRPADPLPGDWPIELDDLSDDDEGFEDNGASADDDGIEPPHSPIEDLIPNADMWGGWEEELEDYLGSDAFDSSEEDGNESDASNSSDRSNRDAKRKRDATDEGGDVDAVDVEGTNGHPESQLQRRKKRALERTSSLTQVATAEQSSGLPSPEATGPEEEGGEAAMAAKTQDGIGANVDDDDNNNDDDDDDNAMERAMLAEFEREDEEDGPREG